MQETIVTQCIQQIIKMEPIKETLKELIGQGLDFLRDVLKLAVEQQILHEKNQFDLSRFNIEKFFEWDVKNTIEFCVAYYDKLIQNSFARAAKNNYLRTLLFEAKKFRNEWAHIGSQIDFSLDQTCRFFDTVYFIFLELQFQQSNSIFQKVLTIRNFLLLHQANLIINAIVSNVQKENQQNYQIQQQNVNRLDITNEQQCQIQWDQSNNQKNQDYKQKLY